MNNQSGIKTCSLIIYLFVIGATVSVEADVGYADSVYGENEIVDQLMVCSLSKSLDLDLTPRGEFIKNTAKSLVEQGFSNKTSILYARLTGLWTARRADLVESSWIFQKEQTSVSSVIELSGISLEIVEKVDVPIHRSQHKLALHKPCKTFDLPLWMCRQSKPVYRTTKTWVNKAYFNLILTQKVGSHKPMIERFSSLFTCPETFRQKITHSPSASHILAKYLLINNEVPVNHSNSPGDDSPDKSKIINKRQTKPEDNRIPIEIGHPVSHHSTQDGRSPATPPYHNYVNLIINQVSEALISSLNDCIQTNDVDLSLYADNQSFTKKKYNIPTDIPIEQKKSELPTNQCSNKFWLKNRLEIANQAIPSGIPENQLIVDGSHTKRSQSLLKYPSDPNQLLNPFGYYHDSSVYELPEDTS